MTDAGDDSCLSPYGNLSREHPETIVASGDTRPLCRRCNFSRTQLIVTAPARLEVDGRSAAQLAQADTSGQDARQVSSRGQNSGDQRWVSRYARIRQVIRDREVAQPFATDDCGLFDTSERHKRFTEIDTADPRTLSQAGLSYRSTDRPSRSGQCPRVDPQAGAAKCYVSGSTTPPLNSGSSRNGIEWPPTVNAKARSGTAWVSANTSRPFGSGNAPASMVTRQLGQSMVTSCSFQNAKLIMPRARTRSSGTSCATSGHCDWDLGDLGPPKFQVDADPGGTIAIGL